MSEGVNKLYVTAGLSELLRLPGSLDEVRSSSYRRRKSMSAALEPLIDVCLKIGVTSPEIESLLRVAFVQRAFVKLPRHRRTGRGPERQSRGLGHRSAPKRSQ